MVDLKRGAGADSLGGMGSANKKMWITLGVLSGVIVVVIALALTYTFLSAPGEPSGSAVMGSEEFGLSVPEIGVMENFVNWSLLSNAPPVDEPSGGGGSGGAEPPGSPPATCGNGVCAGSETHANCPADCEINYYSFVGSTGIVPSEVRLPDVVRKYNFQYVRGGTGAKTFESDVDNYVLRYSEWGAYKYAPSISCPGEYVDGTRIRLYNRTDFQRCGDEIMPTKAEYWANWSAKNNKSVQILDINIDDWLSTYYRSVMGRSDWSSAYWDSVAKKMVYPDTRFNETHATEHMMNLIGIVKGVNPNALFGVVVYAEELNPKATFTSEEDYNELGGLIKKNATLCMNWVLEYNNPTLPDGSRLYNSTYWGRGSNCMLNDSCCGVYTPINVSKQVRESIDVVHLYFMTRNASAELPMYVERAKRQFPNARIIPGIYLWGNFSRTYEARRMPEVLSGTEDREKFIKSVEDGCRLFQSKQVAGLEFYQAGHFRSPTPEDGDITNEPFYWEGIDESEQMSALQSQRIAGNILSNNCVHIGSISDVEIPELD